MLLKLWILHCSRVDGNPARRTIIEIDLWLSNLKRSIPNLPVWRAYHGKWLGETALALRAAVSMDRSSVPSGVAWVSARTDAGVAWVSALTDASVDWVPGLSGPR